MCMGDNAINLFFIFYCFFFEFPFKKKKKKEKEENNKKMILNFHLQWCDHQGPRAPAVILP